MSWTELPPQLVTAYRETTYRVFLDDGHLDLHIGRGVPGLAALMQAHAQDCGTIITAWNPLGRWLPESENRAAQARLRGELIAAGAVLLDAVGTGHDGWAEESCLALGVGRGAALALGARHRQNAIVWIGADAVPLLLLLR